MMPFLGSSLNDTITNNELTLACHNGKPVLKYFENYWPLNKQACDKIPGYSTLNTFTDDGNVVLQSLLQVVNVDKHLVFEIANSQYYRLCSYEETDHKINYRRFFTVNSLMCINIKQPKVFEAYHQLVKKLIGEGVFNGVRIDHIDGLYDPKAYLDDLRKLIGDDTYIVAEKILEEGEPLPPEWPIEGTTGYDFLAQVNNLLTDGSAVKKFTAFYQDMIKNSTPFAAQILQKKAVILNDHMQGELNNLLKYLKKLGLADENQIADVGELNLKKAIGEVLINCPVYRYYGNQLPLNKPESAAIKAILESIAKAYKELKAATELLEIVLLTKPFENKQSYNENALKFYQRLMQFSGPLMAKGVEDTIMYTYNRFIGHNEVGDAPNAFGLHVKEFHKLMKSRQKQWPLALNATSTHDTKRGEDVRARLNVLTAMPDEWFALVNHWQALTNNLQKPDVNDRYFIYQTIVGAYPMPGQGNNDFEERLKEYLIKALREGKQNSAWAKPNEAYEQATVNFAANLLNEKSSFWQSFLKIRATVADHGIINSLAQVLLKFTAPGVPDVYQGCELWDLSLVDPDNRRPVDYQLRENLLNGILPNEPVEKWRHLWDNRYSGHIKLWLTQQLFSLRRSEIDVFAKGEYVPLKTKGTYKDHLIAFARRYQNKWLIVAAPLYTASICKKQNSEPTSIDWKDTRIVIPAEAPIIWENIFYEKELKNEAEILLCNVFKKLPLAVLKAEHGNNERGAGVLMHITSLPSNFGIGDIGPGAKTFANFLSRCGQKYWQLLPINPICAAQNYSPYSPLCSMAGNTLLISPVLLAKDGLISEDELEDLNLPASNTINFTEVEDTKQQLFDTAYDNFQKGTYGQLKNHFTHFCQTESKWLDDFALYLAIKQNRDGQPWHQWDSELKMRDQQTLEEFKDRHLKSIDKIKWLQFIFYRQWHQLKAYCKSLNIKLIGDLPFYISYDSADVWANQHLFALNKDGQITGIAGVPPDYFNANGQLWGMPVYNWPAMEKKSYRWWVNRLKKNMELFDLLRLDHFRAFASFWEVQAGESTAKNGQWMPGPGADFFEQVKNALGCLPFITEDLGDIDDAVFKLRDKFNLPGMKVLQFAFGDAMPRSLYIPHNYSKNFAVYTGTHDNNTILGWYDHDAGEAAIMQLSNYTGIAVKRKNINEVLIRLAYSSAADLAVIPMQDLLKLDNNARMNNPSSIYNNWMWRMLPKLVYADVDKNLLKLVKLYNRQ